MKVSKKANGAIRFGRLKVRHLSKTRNNLGNEQMKKQYNNGIAFSKPQATNNFSQTTASQRHRMAVYLGHKGSISTFEARQELAIQAPAVRKMELEEQGFLFETVRRTLTSATGSTHKGVAVYHLVGFDPDKMTLVDFLRRTGRDYPLTLQFDELRRALQAILAANGVNGHRCLGNDWGFINLDGDCDDGCLSICWGLFPEKAEVGEVPEYREDMLQAVEATKKALKAFLGYLTDGKGVLFDEQEDGYFLNFELSHSGLSGDLTLDLPIKGECYAA